MPIHRVAQRTASRLLTDRVRVVDALTSATMSEATFGADDAADSTLYEGPAQVTAKNSSRGGTEVAGAVVEEKSYSVLLPLEAPIVRPGAIIYVIEAEDPAFVGERFEATQSLPGTGSLLRRYTAKQIVPQASPATVATS